MRIYTHERKADSMFALGLREPAKGAVAIAQQAVNDRNLISGNPLLVSLLQNGLEDDARFFSSANGRQHMRPFGASRRRVARKAPFLLIGRQRFVVHTLLFIGPTQDGVRGDRSRIEGQCLVTLLNSIVESAGKEQDVGHGRGQHG